MSDSSLCNGLDGVYSLGLHVGSIFIVLGSSVLGTCIPIITKFIPFLRNNPFFFVVAKTAATGVLLSVSCIHLINDAVQDFQEPCINEKFREFYSAYAFFFALVAALLMHAVDLQLAAVTERWMRMRAVEELNGADVAAEEPLGDSDMKGGRAVKDVPAAEAVAATAATASTEAQQSGEVDDAVSGRRPGEPRSAASQGAGLQVALPSHGMDVHAHSSHPAGHHAAAEVTEELLESHGHSHAIVLPPSEFPQIRRVIAAICMEFGVTLHSLFVGLDIGLTTDHTLRPLLIALVFHQLFEGISLGSRLVDAKFKTALEVVLALVFSVSAPIGMTVATIAVSIRKDAMAGGGFVLMMAVLNSFCGGILLYLAFSLLFTDFQDELKRYGTPANPRRRVAMFLALWVGMLAMAIVGKWL